MVAAFKENETERLPGFEGEAGFKQTDVGLIPEDWDVLEFGEVGNFKNGINKDSESFGNGSPSST